MQQGPLNKDGYIDTQDQYDAFMIKEQNIKAQNSNHFWRKMEYRMFQFQFS